MGVSGARIRPGGFARRRGPTPGTLPLVLSFLTLPVSISIHPLTVKQSSERSMTITDLVAPEAIIPALKVNNKKQALQELAARAATLTGQSDRAIFEVLLQ